MKPAPVCNSQFRYLLATSLGVTLILLTGCAGSMVTPSHIGMAPQDTTAASLGDSALVFGRIRWIEGGKVRTTYKSALGWNIWFQILRIEDMHSDNVGVDKEGMFTWRLPKGTYVMDQVYWFDAWDGQHRLLPKVAFQVPDGAPAYCLGTLVIDLQSKRDIIGGLWVKGWNIQVEDDCEQLASQFSSSYADPALKPEKSLMVFDPRIPDRPQQLEKRDKTLDFLRAITPGLMTIH